jgi:Methyltransferase domain
MKRRPTPELLDSDSGTAVEIAASLADLRRVNRWFGGIHTTRLMIENVVRSTGDSEFSLLEVAAGSGDVTRRVRDLMRQQGIELRVTMLDRSLSHLERSESIVVADALALPFPNASFDLVSSGLFAHHLCPEELVRFVKQCLRVCRIAVLINDLIRSSIHLGLVYAGYPLYRSRLTRHDGPASVRQAYTLDEMRELVTRAGAERVEVRRHYLFRMGVVAWKQC